MKTASIPVNAIRVLLSRARPKAEWEQLRESMADPAIGLRVPIGVRELPAPDGRIRYELLYGEGRLAAAKALGWKEIPAVIKAASDTEAAGQFLAENMIRRPMAWAEKGRIIRDEIAAGRTLADVAAQLHVSLGLAQKYYRTVQRLAQDVEEAALALPANDAEALATVPRSGQRIVMQLAEESGHRVRDIARAAVASPPAAWTKKALADALRETKGAIGKLAQRLKVLRLHHALGPGNLRALLESESFRAAAMRAKLNLSRLEK